MKITIYDPTNKNIIDNNDETTIRQLDKAYIHFDNTDYYYCNRAVRTVENNPCYVWYGNLLRFIEDKI